MEKLEKFRANYAQNSGIIRPAYEKTKFQVWYFHNFGDFPFWNDIVPSIKKSKTTFQYC